MHTTNDLLASLGPLAQFDPNLIHLVGAALVFGVVMASARGFFGKAHALALAGVMAYTIHLHNWTLLYAAMGYGLLSLMFAGRRARA